MKTYKLLIILAMVIGGVIVFAKRTAENDKPLPITSETMNISSPSFINKENIPSKFTCDANNINPELIFSNVPVGTRSLTLIVHDPDAPVQGGWTHWVIINMDPTTTGIKENRKPSTGLEATTDFGKTVYGGPCPPSGSHHYFFYLYALDNTLSLDQKATKTDVEKAMTGHVLEQAELVGLYKRK